MPCAKGLQYAAQKPAEPVELRVYPGANGCFVYYDDAGDGGAYAEGEYRRITMTWDDDKRILTLHGGEGSMAAEPVEFCAVLGDRKETLLYNGRKISVTL